MKKILLLSLLILAFTFNNFINVKADSASPPNGEYEVVITNSTGAKFYDVYDKGEVIATIPVDTVLTVTFESENQKGEKLLSVEYNQKSGYIKLADCELLYKEYPLEKARKYDKPIKYWLLEKDGAILYTGPSRVYDVVTKIPYDAIITATYYTISSPWKYVEYNGVKGWLWSAVDEPDMNVHLVNITNESNLEIIIRNENAKLYSNISFEKEITTIPLNTKLNCQYIYWPDKEQAPRCYLEYKGEKGWIKKNDLAYKENNSTTIDKDTYLYKDENKTGKYDFIIPNGAVINEVYRYTIFNSNYYIYYNGVYGYLISNSNQENEIIPDDKDNNTNNDNTNNDNTNSIVSWYRQLTKTEFTILCIFLALILSITALVIILVIKNKKKSKC